MVKCYVNTLYKRREYYDYYRNRKKGTTEFIRTTVLEVLAELQSSTAVSQDNLSIDEFLKKIDIPLNFIGFSYINTALKLCLENDFYLKSSLAYIRNLH